MATPKTFNDETLLRTALYNLLENDTELFNAIVGATLNASEWLPGSWTPTYLATNQFTLQGDHIEAYAAGRRVRAHLSTKYIYSHVVEVSFSAATGNSTITLADEILNGTLDEVALGIISPRPTTSLPVEKPLELAPIQLTNWQTNSDQYTVLAQDADNLDKIGKDLFYKYVFTANELSIMYTQIIIPFSGYDLQLVFPYRMSTSINGDVFWQLCWKEISTNEEDAEFNTWFGFHDALDNTIDTPSAIANQLNLIGDSKLVIPSTSYSANGLLKLAFMRLGTNPSDTHTGAAEVHDCIMLVPVLAS